MTTLAVSLAVLAIAVAVVYFTIAVYIVPRIDLDRADRRIVVLVRGGAGAFFIGCALTHLHMANHYLSEPATANTHQLAFHIPQVIGGWLFVVVCGRQLEISVVRKRSEKERLAEEKLAIERQEHARAVERSRLKSSFLANMSHEIRTPMSGVLGITDALLDTELDKTQLEYVRMIRSSGDTLLAVINDILDVSKIEAGKLELEYSEFNLNELVEEVCALFATTASAKGLVLDLAVEPALDANVVGDPLRIRQILTNLIGNAVKFTSEGWVRVKAQATFESHERQVRFEVSDTGPGVEPERRGSIFDEFSQADPSTSRTFGGTGLGLAISKRLAEAMGGSTGMTSELGRGSTFWFTVRLEAPASTPRPSPSVLRGRRAVVVLGAEPDFATLDRQLASWGMEVTTVAADALDAKLSGLGLPPEVILIEEGQACPDPFGLSGSVRRSSPLLPILAVTGRTTAVPLLDGKRFAHLVKPLHRAAVHDTLAALLVDRSPATTPDPTAPPARAGNGVRLLLAEDNHINQVVALAMLNKSGYTVDVARTGREAVEMLKRNDFAAVLMDCQMPELDGYDATREIRRRENGGPRTPIIAMTAHSMVTDRDRCLDAGMDDYISKPVKAADLQAVLARWLPAPGGVLEHHERERSDDGLSSTHH